jgi:sugar phosphate isomerase/epimerase
MQKNMMIKDKIAMQLYTMRDHITTAADFAETMERLSKIGYRAVQLSCVKCMNGDDAELDAESAKKILDDNGLKVIATHRSFDDLLNDTEKEIDFHKTLDCEYAAIGMMPKDLHQKGADGYREFVEQCRPMVEKLNAAGITFGYHNHAKEFVNTGSSPRTCFDILIEEAPFMDIELDIYWVLHAGVDPLMVAEAAKGRLKVTHIKDKEVVIDDGPVIAPVGEGNMNWQSILPAFLKAGTEWFAVEQDSCRRDPFDCARSSYEFLSGFSV